MNRAPRTWGATVLEDGGTRFRLWAPACTRLALHIHEQGDLPMQAMADGWHELTTDRAPAGTRYSYRLTDGDLVPDPASLYQPEGVFGPSEVVDPHDHIRGLPDWCGRPWTEAIVYELHVGTFTPDGTFRAAIGKLPHLVSLGITAIELMPVAAFPGERNWGYDGVFTYAPSHHYGRPEDLMAFVDAAHASGIMVFLDVVYNHLGPEGNLLARYAPAFFTQRHHTPWGAGFNFDGEVAVRQFFLENALHWLENYHLDGLRLDAVHAILDDSPLHFIDELCSLVRHGFPHRPVHLLLENEDNESGRLDRHAGEPTCYTAQWNDDLHHVLHVAVTGEAAGYYGDYQGDLTKLARAIAEGFAYQGEFMNYRGKPRGEPSAHLPPSAFIAFLQNHDQIGNRALGERLTSLTSTEALRAAAALYLLLPQIPMLFMGEEWGADQPFPFFCDFDGELGESVVKGRREEFMRFPEFTSPGAQASIPSPLAVATYDSARLRWAKIALRKHQEILGLYRALIAARRREIIPRLPHMECGGRAVVAPSGAIRVSWTVGDDAQLVLHANLSPRAVEADNAPLEGKIWQEGHWAGREMGPWCVNWSVEAVA